MAVVVHLDPLRHPRQAERLGELAQELSLRRRLGKLAAQRLPRIGERMLDQILSLAAPRHRNLHLVTALGAQRLRQKFVIVDVVRDQDQARTRFVVIELGQKRAEDFFGRNRPVGLGEIGAIAPVLSGAEEKHLDACETALLMERKNIGFLDPARVDALMRLDRR